jgi:glucans biosynthesis protein C
MLLGVVLHSAAPYMHVPLRGLIMPVQEYATSRLPDTIFWIVHALRVPAFFVVAGFLSRESLLRKQPSDFLRSRWNRLGLPLLVGYAATGLLMRPIWLWGWVERDWASWKRLLATDFGPELQRAIWGFNHLWFLEYLLIYSLAAWAVVRLIRRPSTKKPTDVAVQLVRTADINFGQQSTPRPTPATKPPSARRLVPILALAIALGTWLFSIDASWYLDFHNAYVPERIPLAFFAIFFVLGWTIRREWLGAIAKASPVFLLLVAACFFPMLSLIASTVWQTDHGPRQGRLIDSESDRLLLGFLVSTVATLGSLGLMGLASVVCKATGRAWTLLIDAAYWVYLTHLIWVGLGVMLLHYVALAPELKMAIVAAFAAAASIASFIPIRRTELGRWLGSTALARG